MEMDADDGIQEQTYLEDKETKSEQFKQFIESTKLGAENSIAI